jgi:hypothetical protein
VGSAVHAFDHLRRGQGSVTEQLFWVGQSALVLQVVVVTLIVTRHRLAPLVAALTGFPLALGFAAAHWLPTWSSLSDSFVSERASAFSYVASALEIAGALAVGITGWRVLRDERERERERDQRDEAAGREAALPRMGERRPSTVGIERP